MHAFGKFCSVLLTTNAPPPRTQARTHDDSPEKVAVPVPRQHLPLDSRISLTSLRNRPQTDRLYHLNKIASPLKCPTQHDANQPLRHSTITALDTHYLETTGLCANFGALCVVTPESSGMTHNSFLRTVGVTTVTPQRNLPVTRDYILPVLLDDGPKH